MHTATGFETTIIGSSVQPFELFNVNECTPKELIAIIEKVFDLDNEDSQFSGAVEFTIFGNTHETVSVAPEEAVFKLRCTRATSILWEVDGVNILILEMKRAI